MPRILTPAQRERANELRRIRAQQRQTQNDVFARILQSNEEQYTNYYQSHYDVPVKPPSPKAKPVEDKNGYVGELRTPLDVLHNIKHEGYRDFINYCRYNHSSKFQPHPVWHTLHLDDDTEQIIRIDLPTYPEYGNSSGEIGMRNQSNHIRQGNNVFGFNVVAKGYKIKVKDEFFHEVKDINFEA